MKRIAITLAVGLAVAAGFGIAGSSLAQKDAAPNVVGLWSGSWGIYAPPQLDGAAGTKKGSNYTAAQKAMDCKVVRVSGNKWEATFEGECGRPYKYTVKMIGRQNGKVVMFKGTADLGAKDGGVYDWIGRANDTELVGFFTSQGYTGTFRLARPKK